MIFSKRAIQISTVILVAASWGTANAAGNFEAGHAAYQMRCAACHSVDFNGAGPAHRGVFGRNAAQANGFGGYSKALKSSGLVWTELNLERWLTDPEKLVPGQGMGVSVPEDTVRADLIAYLKSIPTKK